MKLSVKVHISTFLFIEWIYNILRDKYDYLKHLNNETQRSEKSQKYIGINKSSLATSVIMCFKRD